LMGMQCLVEKARMLGRGLNAEVMERTACCRVVSCMLASNRLAVKNYEEWFLSEEQRTQLMRGTERKDQGLEFSDNIILLRCLVVQETPVLTDIELEALWKWVVQHSQFIHEREKRFIATALAVIGNDHLFGYKFNNRQNLVDRMAAFPRNYAHRIIFPHIKRMDMSAPRWKSTFNKLLETAMPKPYDVIYALLCVDNWIYHSDRVRDPQTGRPLHRVRADAPHAKLLTNAYDFRDALKLCAQAGAKPYRDRNGKLVEPPVRKYALRLAGAEETDTMRIGKDGSRETRQMQRAITGTNKTGWTEGTPVFGMPTCGSRQNDSGAHPAERYRSVFAAEGLPDAECDEMVDLFVQRYGPDNTVGYEKTNPKDPNSLSKPCAVLRPVEVVRNPHLQESETVATTCCFKLLSLGSKQKAKTKPLGGLKALGKRTIGWGVAKSPKTQRG